MPRERTVAAIKTLLGFFLGVALYYVFVEVTGPEWTDSVEVLTEGCERQGMATRFGISEGALTHWECVAPELTGESQRGGSGGSSSM